MSGQRPLVKSISRGLAVLGRLGLMASLWHAPVPVIHLHGSDIDESPSPSAAVEHLTECHSGMPVNSHVDFGWHVHFVLWADPVADEPCDEDGQPDRAPYYAPFVAPPAQAGPMLALSLEWQSPTCWCPQLVDRPALAIAPANRSQFLGTYLDAVPLRTLLRVARC
jgi:hypothetical protein